jgi:hypothetical protein
VSATAIMYRSFDGEGKLLAPPRAAFARMFSWADDIPGWCDRPEPVAAALQAAEWIRVIYGEMDDWRDAEQSHWAAVHENAPKAENGAPRLILGEINGIVTRYRHQIGSRATLALQAINEDQPRYLSPADIQAAFAVINYWNRSLLIRLARRQRLRSYVTDWTLVKYALLEHMTTRETAERLGLDRSGSGVASRINDAIAAVADDVGEFPLDFPAPRLVWSKPKLLSPQIPRVACYNKIIRPAQFRNPKPLTIERPPLRPAADDRWLIAEHLEYADRTRLCRLEVSEAASMTSRSEL